MSKDFLTEILIIKQKRVQTLKQKDLDWIRKIEDLKKRPSRSFAEAFLGDRINIIAEIKKASPSKGVINNNVDVVKLSKTYEASGACAISVLTEENKFHGSFEDLSDVRKAVNLPLLCKDFIFDEFQIYQAKKAGADAILLIVAMLDEEKLKNLYDFANNLGLDVLVEVHTEAELEIAKKIGAKIIGVNNRDLHTFDVSLDVSRNLIKQAPKNALMISESGISKKEEILELKLLGFSGFLIGETFMKSNNLRVEFANLLNKHG
jgi:indole-3-glycerol phosphate synthase